MARQMVWLEEEEAVRVQRVRRHGECPRIRQWADILWLLHHGSVFRK